VAVVCLLLLPVLELTVLIQVGRALGAAPVLLWVLGALLLGAWVTRREIGRLLRALNRQTGRSDNVVRVPRARSAEFADASLGILAGLLLLLPGLVSDLAAFVLLVPAGRKLARRWIGRAATNWTTKMAARGGVVQGEIIDVEIGDLSRDTQRPAAPQEPRPLPPGGEGMPPG
jgi:UPF0716 protein FxsA